MQGSLNNAGEPAIDIDITRLNFHQLEELRGRVDHRVTEMRETGHQLCVSNGPNRQRRSG